MNLSEIMRLLNNVSWDDLVPLKEVQTERDIEKFKAKGYLPNFTEKQWVEQFPDIDPDKVYFLNGLNVGTVYCDGVVFVNLPVWSKDTVQFKQLRTSLPRIIREKEEQHKKKEYVRMLLAAPDWAVPKLLSNLLELDGPSDKFYDAFLTFYTYVNADSSSFGTDIWEKLNRMKSSEQAKETRKYLDRDFEGEEVTVYRGWADKSALPERATSWTPDINVAYFFASRLGTKPMLTTGVVQKDKILEYFPFDREDGAEVEIVTLPGQVQVQKTVALMDVGSEMLCANVRKVLSMYKDYAEAVSRVYQNRKEEHSAHNAKHSTRVLLYALLLAQMMKLPDADKVRLAEAAAYHDCGRANDFVDGSHGDASAKVYESVGKDSVVSFVIRQHCLSDGENRASLQEGFSEPQRKRCKVLLDVFKDADALDRLRFGFAFQTQDGLDVTQLRTAAARDIVPFASQSVKSVECHKTKSNCSPRAQKAYLARLRKEYS